jgi:hypothetical protein
LILQILVPGRRGSWTYRGQADVDDRAVAAGRRLRTSDDASYIGLVGVMADIGGMATG